MNFKRGIDRLLVISSIVWITYCGIGIYHSYEQYKIIQHSIKEATVFDGYAVLADEKEEINRQNWLKSVRELQEVYAEEIRKNAFSAIVVPIILFVIWRSLYWVVLGFAVNDKR